MEASRSARMRSSDSAPSTSVFAQAGQPAQPLRVGHEAQFHPADVVHESIRGIPVRSGGGGGAPPRHLALAGLRTPQRVDRHRRPHRAPGAPPSAAGSSSSARCWRSGQATQAPGSAPLPLSTPGRAVGELSNELLHVSSCCRFRHGLDTEGVAPTARSPHLDAVTACEVIEFAANTAGQRLRTPDKAAPTKTPHLSVVAPATPA